MQAQIELLDSLLDTDKYSNDFMKDLVDKVRTGDITIAINAALAVSGDVGIAVDAVTTIVSGINDAKKALNECRQDADTSDEARRKAEQAEADNEKDAESSETVAMSEAELDSEMEKVESTINTATNPTEEQKKKVRKSDHDKLMEKLEKERKKYGLSQEDMF